MQLASGPERCILFNPCNEQSREIPWKGQNFEFQTLQFGLASAMRVFTKLLRPVGSCDAKKGNKTADLFQQHPDPGTGGIVTVERPGRGGRNALPSRVHHQPQEISLQANTSNQLSWFYSGHKGRCSCSFHRRRCRIPQKHVDTLSRILPKEAGAHY